MADRKLKAVIWDMDGLLLDTERVSHDSWTAAAIEMGAEIDEELFKSIIGMNRQGWEAHLRAELDHKLDVDELIAITNRIYSRKIDQGVALKEGARECLNWLESKAIPQALATSTSRPYTLRKMDPHDLMRLFQSVVTGDQVERGKPNPEIFQKAAQGLGLDPSECIVFEDSRHGIMGAAASGAEVVLVRDMAKHDEESLSKVHHQFHTLSDALPYLEAVFS